MILSIIGLVVLAAVVVAGLLWIKENVKFKQTESKKDAND